jgi:hypothetical protein
VLAKILRMCFDPMSWLQNDSLRKHACDPLRTLVNHPYVRTHDAVRGAGLRRTKRRVPKPPPRPLPVAQEVGGAYSRSVLEFDTTWRRKRTGSLREANRLDTTTNAISLQLTILSTYLVFAPVWVPLLIVGLIALRLFHRFVAYPVWRHRREIFHRVLIVAKGVYALLPECIRQGIMTFVTGTKPAPATTPVLETSDSAKVPFVPVQE